jgi:hypothetical protein
VNDQLQKLEQFKQLCVELGFDTALLAFREAFRASVRPTPPAIRKPGSNDEEFTPDWQQEIIETHPLPLPL